MKIYYYLDKCGDEMMTAERNAFLRKHLTANSYEILMEYLENKKVMFSAPVEEDTETLTEATLDSLTDGQEIFRKLILPYRGRVIYIDVWGTWCGPCREEMEHLPIAVRIPVRRRGRLRHISGIPTDRLSFPMPVSQDSVRR